MIYKIIEITNMKIGIISDTHDDISNTNKAIDIFKENNVEAVLHAGDIISPPIILEFKRLTDLGIKFFGILGNNDGEEQGLKSMFKQINGNFLGVEGKIDIDDLRIGIYHGQDLKKKQKMIDSGKFDVFIYGHTHSRDPQEERPNYQGKTLVLNPGSAHRAEKSLMSNRSYFKEPSVLIFDTVSKEIKFHYL
jgi:putative phosphoesterase